MHFSSVDIQIKTPLPDPDACLVRGLSDLCLQGGDALHLYDPHWADRLANCLGGDAVAHRLAEIPEQILFMAGMIANNADAGNLHGVLQHCRQLKGMAARFRSSLLVEALNEIAESRTLPNPGVLHAVQGLSEQVAGAIRTHLASLIPQS